MSFPPGLKKQLLPHQAKALDFTLPILRGLGHSHAIALLRLPTGTGKTGIIATLAIADPPTKWTLVLTPWANLCRQMAADLKKNFWRDVQWSPPKMPKVERLLPSNAAGIFVRKERLVLVATFATLADLKNKRPSEYAQLKNKVSEVIVDEGHYEPAAEWGQAVKGLEAPTLILTATPYRNDLKLFRVPKNHVFHFTHADAEVEKVIRKVIVKKIGTNEPQSSVAKWCDEFAKYWKGPEPKAIHPDPKAILSCKDSSTIESVVEKLRKLGIEAVGVHERFGGRRKNHLLADVPDTKKSTFQVWVHQHKMTEGLDNSQFCVLGVVNRIRTDRRLIQQIGRIIRRKGGSGQPAAVFHSDDLDVPRSWNNYREFELVNDMVDPERYHAALAAYLNQQPRMEYFGGKFRRQFDPYSSTVASEVRLRSSAAIRRTNGRFSIEEFIKYTTDELLLADRILLGPNRDMIRVSSAAGIWVYATVANSEALTTNSLYEFRLGALAYAVHGTLLFMSSTDETGSLEYTQETTSKLSSRELAKILGKQIRPREVGLSNPWPTGSAIQRTTIQAQDLLSTPTQLTDSVMVCGSVRASSEDAAGENRRHYVGFKRSRITEHLRAIKEEAFGTAEFFEWSQQVAQALDNPHRRVPVFFKRYLQPIPPPANIGPKYVIFNFDGALASLQNADGQPVELEETITRVTPRAQVAGKWDVKIEYTITGNSNVLTTTLELIFDQSTSRFRFKGEHEEQDDHPLFAKGPADAPIPLSRFLNQHDDNHFISLEDPGVYYGDEQFFEIDYSDAEERLTSLLTPVSALATVSSEKGSPGRLARSWQADSVFGVICSTGNAGIRRYFKSLDLFICDDMNTEAADFVAVSFNPPRLILVHAKDNKTRNGKPRKVSGSALHEVVSQAQKNLNHFVGTFPAPKHIARWTRTAVWQNTRIRRWIEGSPNLPEAGTLWKKICDEVLRSPRCQTEVWLVLGRSLEFARLKHQISQNRTTEAGQVLHLLYGLNAACTQVGSQLRVFCH